MGVSLKPSEATQGGLVDDVTVLWKECRFEMWNYGGAVAIPVPALKLDMEDTTSKEVYTQYWSMGSSKDWVPSADGKELVPVGTVTTLRHGSNGMLLLTSLVNAGFPEDKLGDDVTALEGMVSHMIRVAAPKRSGLDKPKKTSQDGKEYVDTVMIVDKIEKLPWEKGKAMGAVAGAPAGAKGKGAGTAAAKSATSAAQATAAGVDQSDLSAQATALVLELLSESGGTCAKKDIPTAAFKKLANDPNRSAIVQLVFKDEFLAEGPWTFVDGVVSM